METTKHLEEFMKYLAESGDLKPDHEFSARAAKAEKAPTFAYSLPLGTIILYPRYLVFLTLYGEKPGTKILMKEFLKILSGQLETRLKFIEWAENPLTLLRDTAKWLSGELKQENKFSEALVNPNSLFVPLTEVKGVKFVKGIISLRPHHIVVSLNDSNLIIYQDAMTENYLRSFVGQFTGKWQAEFLSQLESISKVNIKS